MLKIKTYINKSSIHGIGLFAGEDIGEGELIWAFTPEIDRWIEYDKIEHLTKNELDYLENAAVYDDETDSYCLVADNVRFMNHNSNPNCGECDRTTDDYMELFALKNIKKGEEITLNYNQMEEGSDNFNDEIFKNYNL